MTQQPAGTVLVPVSLGELVDKITILEIKTERMHDQAKIANVRIELDLLRAELNRVPEGAAHYDDLRAQLKTINEKLWVIEDDIRDCERAKDFGETFIALARAVYVTNDERAAVKRAINTRAGSLIVEEKSYQPYA